VAPTRILAGKHEEKLRLGRPRRMWEDNIKMDLEVKDREAWTEFISLGTVALADTITNGRILYNARMMTRRTTIAI